MTQDSKGFSYEDMLDRPHSVARMLQEEIDVVHTEIKQVRMHDFRANWDVPFGAFFITVDGRPIDGLFALDLMPEPGRPCLYPPLLPSPLPAPVGYQAVVLPRYAMACMDDVLSAALGLRAPFSLDAGAMSARLAAAREKLSRPDFDLWLRFEVEE